MRTATILAAVAVVAWAASAVTGGVPVAVQQPVERDNGSNLNDNEQYNNRGACGGIRGAKGPYGECYYADFFVGTDALEDGSLRKLMADNPLLNATEQYRFTFYFMPYDDPVSGSWPDNGTDPDAQLWTLNLLYDWAEGDGPSLFTQWNWTDPTVNPAATDLYAQTYEDPANAGNPDPARCVQWTTEAGTPQGRYYNNNALHKLQNSTDIYVDPSTDYDTYVGVVLDYDPDDDPLNPTKVVNDLLYNPLNRGIAFKGLLWDLTYMYTNDAADGQRPYLELAVVCKTGDANRDGVVDGLDYNAWSLHYLQAGGWPEGDFNGDGTVDGLDYNAWSLNYEGGAGAAVPEPACLALLAAGALALIRRRR